MNGLKRSYILRRHMFGEERFYAGRRKQRTICYGEHYTTLHKFVPNRSEAMYIDDLKYARELAELLRAEIIMVEYHAL